MKDLSAYIGTLPYASELFGIYQPLLGWKSKLTERRFDLLRQRAYFAIAEKVLNRVRAPITVQVVDGHDAHAARFANAQFKVDNLKPINLERISRSFLSPSIESGVSLLLREGMGNEPPNNWRDIITLDKMTGLLEALQKILTTPEQLARHPQIASYVDSFLASLGQQDRSLLLRALFDKESRIAGYLIFLAQYAPSQLTSLFFRIPKHDLLQTISFSDPLLNFGENAYQAILSPIGIIHLFREYFFEFDSFLGPPVGHIWLSPGGTTELIEVNTRKVVTERSFETSTETIHRSESATTTKDEIADAIKEENQNNMKFGFTNTLTYKTPVWQNTATPSFSLENAKTTSRETTHKQMREQSEKLTSEIKRNFKTTFRTTTEVTDTTSKRYVIQNTTNRLVNYELRRKMRKVGVQVQDIGVQLCWHTFVDDPGRELGISKLVHISNTPEMSGLTEPEGPVYPGNEPQEVAFPIPFVGLGHDEDDMAYRDGVEDDTDPFESDEGAERIQADFEIPVAFSKPGYTLADVQLEVVAFDAQVSRRGEIKSVDGSSTGTFVVHLDYVDWNDISQFTVKARLIWTPSEALKAPITDAYNKAMEKFNAESARRQKEEFYKAARERIKLASKIEPRPAEDLREEERTVVYRKLISQLMSVAPNESKHVISELVRSIFDIDKMLYFVAPEWWVPRLHRSTQHLGEEASSSGESMEKDPSSIKGRISSSIVRTTSLFTTAETKAASGQTGKGRPKGTPISAANIVEWGGAKEYRRDNYYITEDSAHAKLGSSLGWLLQLDGDNLRNALLNAPWVKAVIPIRIGKEQEAINWLRQAHVEGEEGLNARYVATPEDPSELQSTSNHEVTVLEALTILSNKIREFDQRSRTIITPNPADASDPRNHFAGSLPTEAVYESGFYPLKGGVRFNQEGTDQAIFSQWMEILPTDQVAALEVEYDPKTLQVKITPQPSIKTGQEGPEN